MKKLILILLFFLPLYHFAQKSVFTDKWYAGAELDWGIWSELQLGVNCYFLPKTNLGHGLALKFGYNFKESSGFVTQLSYQAIHVSSIFFYGISHLNLKYYPYLDNHLVVAPELGFGLFYFFFSYQPNIPVMRGDNINLPVHQFRLGININPIPSIGPSLRTGNLILKSARRR